MQEQSRSDLWRYIAVMRRWAWLLIGATVAGAIAGFIASKMQAPVYQASTTLLINEAPSTRSSVDYNTLLASERLAGTYVQLLTERMVLEDVIPRLQNRTTVDWLKGAVSASTVRNTQLMEVRVEDTSPRDAADIANTLAVVFAEKVREMQSARYQASKESLATQTQALDQQIKQIQEELAGLPITTTVDTRATRDRLEATLTQYRQSYTTLLQTYEQIRFAESQTTSNVSQVELAVPPGGPIRPRTTTNILLAAAVGFLLSLGTAFLFESLDDTLKSTAQIASDSGLPVLGFIPFFTPDVSAEASAPVPMVSAQPRSPTAERFRALRTNIQYASVDRPLRTLLITSAGPGDGKSTVATNLAVAMAQGRRRVAMVDADLRRPTLHKKMGLANQNGMSDLFIQEVIHLNGTLQATLTPGLSVITAGGRPPNPSELLGSERMVDILRQVADEADLVIVDTPPATSVTDALVLAPKVDGVLLVVRPGQTKLAAAREAIMELKRSGANVLGIVVNGVKAEDARYYYGGYYHYYYYHYYDENHAPKATGWRRVRQEVQQLFRGSKRSRRSTNGSQPAAEDPDTEQPEIEAEQVS